MTALQRESTHRRIRRDQQERLEVLGIAAGSYALDTLWLTVFSSLGIIQPYVPIAYGASAGLAIGLFFLLLARSWNLRLRDPNLTIAQMGFGYLLQLVFLSFAPQAGVIFLSTIFVVSAFGTLTMSVRQFVWAWLLVGCGLGVALIGVGNRLTVPVATLVQQLAVWFVFMSTFGRVVLLNIRVGTLRNMLRQRNHELRTSVALIERLASVDELTQVWNRRTFLKFIEEEMTRAARTGATFCVALLDLDHFKSVNDRFGHLVGDQVLKAFAEVVNKTLRSSDRLGRYGGEEFVLMLPDIALDDGIQVAERIRGVVAGADWGIIAPELALTVSIGITAFRKDASVEELLARSDHALYCAKREGRNQTRTQ